MSVRRRLFAGDPSLMAADYRLIQEANQALELTPSSVLDKPASAPSGEARDYASIDPFYWPDETSTDGLPYIRRPDEVNPEISQWDQVKLNITCSAINTLSLAYFLSDLEEFAAHAALLLRTWFLDESTGMRPHLTFAGVVPGRCEGDHRGISEGIPLTWMIDAVGLLAEAGSWTSADDGEFKRWFEEYLSWLRVSDHGRSQAVERDYHGTWYDVQVAAAALFLGDDDLCRRVTAETAPRRLTEQIDATGRQIHEDAKEHNVRHSATNLGGLFELADLADRVGVDLWSYESSSGASIRKAFYWLIGRISDWDDGQPADSAQLLPLARRGGLQFQDPSCEELFLLKAGSESSADRTNLLYPISGEDDFS